MTLTRSIEISFSNTTRPKYSICFFWNLHFSRQRQSLYSTRISSTLQIVLAYYSIVLVKMRISFKYTTTISLVMRSLKMLFIIVQKIARLLVIPKNITKGSNKPQLVQKVVFHLFPGLMHILLKPQQMSSLVKYLALGSYNTSLEMRGKEYLFFTIMELRAQQSCTSQRELFFFLMKNTRVAIGDLDGYIYLVYRFSYRKASNFFCLMGERRQTFVDLGLEPRVSSIIWFQQQYSSKISKSSLVNTDSKSLA